MNMHASTLYKFSTATCLAGLLFFSNMAMAGPTSLLGVTVGYPQISLVSASGQGLTYDGTTMTVASGPSFTLFTANGVPQFVTAGSFSITATISSAGALSGGTFTISGTVTDSATSITYSGVLLSGTVVDYGMSNIGAPGGTDLGDFKLQPTAGQMMALFGTGQTGAILTYGTSSFNGSFAAPFGATSVSGTVGPIPVAIPPTGTGDCSNYQTHGKGYWVNNPNLWPIKSVTVGGVTYQQADAISLLKRAPHGDKSIIMVKNEITAILNIASGACHACIDGSVAGADNWLSGHGGVASGTTSWNGGDDISEDLSDYNQGRLCAKHVIDDDHSD